VTIANALQLKAVRRASPFSL